MPKLITKKSRDWTTEDKIALEDSLLWQNLKTKYFYHPVNEQYLLEYLGSGVEPFNLTLFSDSTPKMLLVGQVKDGTLSTYDRPAQLIVHPEMTLEGK